MKLLAKVDRCHACRPLKLRIIGRDQPTAYGDRRLPVGLHARWGRLRLRLYLLGPERHAVGQHPG